MRAMTIDREEHRVLRYVTPDGRKLYTIPGEGGGPCLAIGRSRGELLGDFRRRQMEARGEL